jgi:hypothetical protein
MDPRTAGGLPSLLESTLLTMRPANHERMRHDLHTLAARLPDEVDDQDFAGEGDIWWRCPHEVAYALESRRERRAA